MDEYIGKLLDNRYEILERIGSGGMAVVYKARCHRLNRLVAIKILKSDLAQDAEFRRRFHDESQAVAMLSHPNIVAVYDVSKASDLDYIVMELIDGITLKQYMQKKGEPLNWRESLHFITQIMKGLSHAHSRGIIHRDIKPHNIMVLRDGSVKVADFGIARLTSAAHSTLTQEALGSVHYISPEQARGSRIDCRSDIYSAGVVLYEMTTGRLPYEGDSPVSVAIQHINSIPLSPREINPEIPEALESITMKAMASDPDKRYASADAMLEDLEEFRKNPSISFEYTNADLNAGTDEPTQVREPSGAHNFHGALDAADQKTGGEKPPRKRPQGGGKKEHDGREEREMSGRKDTGRRRSDRGSIWPTVLAVCAILVFLCGVGYFLYQVVLGLIFPASTTYEVPRLVGNQYEQVLAQAEELAPFTVVLGTTEVSDKPQGEILSQDPDAGRSVKSGSLTITVTVSGGNNYYILEDYTNRRASDVKLFLESKGIHVTLEETSSDTITTDFIVSQDVSQGTEMKAGDTITLFVSTGPEKPLRTVTPLIGLPLDQAKDTIDRLGLKLDGVTEDYDPDQAVGNVIWQSINAFTEVEEGTSISLKLSKGPDPSIAPPSPSQSQTSPPPSHLPAVTPTPSGSTEDPGIETPPPVVTPTPAPAVRPTVVKSIRVDLPADRTTPVEVLIIVSGESFPTIIDTTMASPVYLPVSAPQGLHDVDIYIDGVLTDSRSEDFS